ncbi:MAG: GNAT family N-acetyltransferase [Rhodomicrobium sp.]
MAPEIHPISPADLDQCLQLSNEESGWNQNAADWKFILEEGVVFGIKRDAHLIATAGVMPYGERFGWICMVLVRASERRQGLASLLMQRCVGWLAERGSIAGLDATQAGREVYRQIGFRDVYGITRMHAAGVASTRDGLSSANLTPLTADTIDAVAGYDRQHFGEDRSALLRRWLERKPQSAFFTSNGGHIRGFVVAREGRNASHIGPTVADDETTAIALIEAALNTIQGPVIIDVPTRHRILHQWLRQRGFSPQRSFTRMLLSRTEPLDSPEQIFAVTGAEFG